MTALAPTRARVAQGPPVNAGDTGHRALTDRCQLVFDKSPLRLMELKGKLTEQAAQQVRSCQLLQHHFGWEECNCGSVLGQLQESIDATNVIV